MPLPLPAPSCNIRHWEPKISPKKPSKSPGSCVFTLIAISKWKSLNECKLVEGGGSRVVGEGLIEPLQTGELSERRLLPSTHHPSPSTLGTELPVSAMTPRQIVTELDRYIVGQDA